jgi:hypothetical protein
MQQTLLKQEVAQRSTRVTCLETRRVRSVSYRYPGPTADCQGKTSSACGHASALKQPAHK